MLVRTKPLKIKLIETQNPLEDFMHKEQRLLSVTKEVLFVRYIGIPNTIQHYIENIHKIDHHFSSAPPTYLRLHELERLSNLNNIHKLSTVWENWEPILPNPGIDSKILYQTPLGTSLDNETIEWTKKLTFAEVVSQYKKQHPQPSATQLKNFAVKFLNWMESYLPTLFNGKTHFPKVVFIGDIKQHELLFLCFLSRLGCDIFYMNPKEDIRHLYPNIKKVSTLYKCGNFYSNPVAIPDLKPAPTPKIPSSPVTIIQPKVSSPIQFQANAKEFSYEELASLSSSVVMIKTYNEKNEIVCSGSGVVIHSSGYILTNLHVVAGGSLFSVLYENETEEYLTGNFIKYHQQYDLAILKVDKHCAPLPIKMDGQLVRGQKIVAIGSPLGLFNSVSDGIVSGFREIKDIPMIQFTAPISDGSSGGALLDMYGRLVGLITAGFNHGQNLNLAVPADKIYQFGQNFIENPN